MYKAMVIKAVPQPWSSIQRPHLYKPLTRRFMESCYKAGLKNGSLQMSGGALSFSIC